MNNSPEDRPAATQTVYSRSVLARASRMAGQDGPLYQVAARARDLGLAIAGIALTVPPLILFGIAAGISSGASPIFKQVRVGKEGRPFVIYKLRTLYPQAPSGVHKAQSEHLATPLGRFLRTTKIDELPQLWNVIKGDMALVGPRPIIPSEYGESPEKLRLTVRPGVTGLWQLSRVRDHRFNENPEYDLFYLANRSFSFDAWLIWRTVLLLFTGRETRLRHAARLWERNRSWRRLVPEREISVPPRDGTLRRLLPLYVAITVGALVALGGFLVVRAASDFGTDRTAVTEAEEPRAKIASRSAASAITSGDTPPTEPNGD